MVWRPDRIADWRPGHEIDSATRKKVVFAHGLGSFTGAATFGPIEAELVTLGFGPGDFLEVTPLVSDGQPRPYQTADLRGPLEHSIAGVTACLTWYGSRLPAGQELHLIGYSLGGLLLVRALARLARPGEPTPLPVRSVITLNSPLAGLPPEAPGLVGAIVNAGRHLREAERLLDPIIQDLLAEGRDPAADAQRSAEFARILAAGVEVTVIGSLDDQIVAPAQVAPDLPGLERIEIVNETSIRPSLQLDRFVDRLLRAGREHGIPVPGLDRPGAGSFWFGHSAILTDPAAHLAIWEHVGYQEPASAGAP